MAKTIKDGKWKIKYLDDFSGGVNSYLGVRQIKDNESPIATNCDFLGKTGIGNRNGYLAIGSVTGAYDELVGMGTLHTSALHQLIRFTDNDADVTLEHSTDDGVWTQFTTTKFTTGKPIRTCQALSRLYINNGNNDVMRYWTGSAITAQTDGKKGSFPTYYGQRLWIIDATNPDTINFSGQYANPDIGTSGGTSGGSSGAAADKFGYFTDATAGSITIEPGSGAFIMGMISFQNYLYVFLRDKVYRVYPAQAADTFVVELVTSAVGCVAGGSIAQVEEDIFFASDDGVYSLGEVANYTSVRTTNKSVRIQQVFNNMVPALKSNMVAKYNDFKYYLFYSLGGTINDSCMVYDVRYKGWQDWRNMPASSAVLYRDSDDEVNLYFGDANSGKVYKMGALGTDNGTAITSTFYTKSFDEMLPDITKLYFDTTFVFGELSGTVTVSIIFDDRTVSATKSISQLTPMGGIGRDKFGYLPFGDSTNTGGAITVYQGVPLRVRVKDKKFAIQYKITSTGHWRLDNISQMFFQFSHFKFPSQYKLN